MTKCEALAMVFALQNFNITYWNLESKFVFYIDHMH